MCHNRHHKQMLSDNQEQFIQEQAKEKNGQEWLSIFKTLADSLYSTKGVNEEDWKPRQIAASLLERELIGRIEVNEGSHKKPLLNKEYL